MRSIWMAAIVLGATLALAGPSVAQDKKDRPGFRGAGNVASLVQNASVQKEIKLSEEQTEKAKKVGQDVLAKFKDDLSKLTRESTPEERAEVNKKVSAEAYKSLADVLKDDQVKRLKQIELQLQGFNNPDSQKALKLSDEQKDKLKTIREDAGKKRREIREDAKGDFKEMREKMTTLNKETKEKETGVLTDEQKKQWKEMVGEPFEIKFDFQPPKREL